MENEFHNIDDLFRESFSDYSETPPPAVWPALEKRLGKEKKRRAFPLLRWYWFCALLAFITLFGAIITADPAKTRPVSTITAVSPHGAAVVLQPSIDSVTHPAHDRKAKDVRPAQNSHATRVVNVEKRSESGKGTGLKTHKSRIDKESRDEHKTAGENEIKIETEARISANAPTVGTSVYSYDDFEEDTKSGEEQATMPASETTKGYQTNRRRRNHIVVAEMAPQEMARTEEKMSEYAGVAVAVAGPNPTPQGNEETAVTAQTGKHVASTHEVGTSARAVSVHNRQAPDGRATRQPVASSPIREKAATKVAARPKKMQSEHETAKAVLARAKAVLTGVTKKKKSSIAVAARETDVRPQQVATTPAPSSDKKPALAKVARKESNVAVATRETEVRPKQAVTPAATSKAAKPKSPGKALVGQTAKAVSSPVNATRVLAALAHSATRGRDRSYVVKADANENKHDGGLKTENSMKGRDEKLTIRKVSAKQHDASQIVTLKGTVKKVDARTSKENVAKEEAIASAEAVESSGARRVNDSIARTKAAMAALPGGVPAGSKPASFKENQLTALHGSILRSAKPAVSANAKIPPVIAAVGSTKAKQAAPERSNAQAEEGIPVSAVPPPVAKKPTDSMASAEPAEVCAEPATDTSAAGITPFMRFVFGIKGGFESGFSISAGNKVLVMPYVRYHFSEKFALQFQPGIKVGRLATRTIGNPGAYHSIHAGTGEYELTGTSMLYLVFTGDTLEKRDYTYTEQYDSIIKQNQIGGSYAELELPLLLHYQLSKRVAVYGGINMVLGKRFSIKEETKTYGGLTATGETFTLARLNEPIPVPGGTGVNYTSAPISSYSGPAFPTDNGSVMRMGYMLGFSYEWKKRWTADVAVQQCFMQKNIQGGYNVNSALSAPYFRFTVGYRLTK